MLTDYSTIALLVDRSGSMHSIAPDVVGSVKQFIGDQKKNSGKASLTVVQFDDKYEEVYSFKDLKEVDEDKFVKEYSPRGSTALLDAIARTTLTMEKRIETMDPKDRPKRVVVAIITDGMENSSKEFNITQIRDLIKRKEAAGWDFMFMGATLDAINVASSMGFSASKSASYNTSNFKSCMQSVSENVTRARLNKEVSITEAERVKLKEAQKQPV